MSTLPSNWSPAERKMWLLSHHAPPDMHLITDAEMEMVQGQMRRAMALEVEVTQTIKELDAAGYWLMEPTLHDAAAAAVFDARRVEKVMDKAIEVLKHLNPVRLSLITDEIKFRAVATEIREALDFFLAEQSARRDRTAPTPENPNQNPL